LGCNGSPVTCEPVGSRKHDHSNRRDEDEEKANGTGLGPKLDQD
jgi:hypothetical protein